MSPGYVPPEASTLLPTPGFFQALSTETMHAHKCSLCMICLSEVTTCCFVAVYFQAFYKNSTWQWRCASIEPTKSHRLPDNERARHSRSYYGVNTRIERVCGWV